jgi:phage-related baseplate assembly protein
MDKEIVRQAMKLSGEGLSIAQVAKRLGVNQKSLRNEIADYDDFSEVEAEVAVIVPAHNDIGSTAYDLLTHLLTKMRAKAGSPFVSMGDLAAASALCYRIYKEEKDVGSASDGSDPIMRLFGDEIKMLEE